MAKRLCLRCGADPDEEAELGDFGCRVYDKWYPKHLWGVEVDGEGVADG